jgi:bifunctional DNase/RNase
MEDNITWLSFTNKWNFNLKHILHLLLEKLINMMTVTCHSVHIKNKISNNYTAAIERSPTDGGEDGTRGFPLSAYF